MEAHIAQCESNCFSAHTNKTDVVGVRGRCASCTGLNQLFKQLRANDVITNTDLQALSAPSGATGHIFRLIHLIIFAVRYLTVYDAHCGFSFSCSFVYVYVDYHLICCVSFSYVCVNPVTRSAPCILIIFCKMC